MFPPLLVLSSCYEIPNGSTAKNDLAKLKTGVVQIAGKGEYNVWIADTEVTRQLGLMNVSKDELPDDQGMLFIFEADQPLGFWMRNTIIPLDIAYIRSDGVVVKTYTMVPLNESTYPSIEPAQYALEVNAGQFQEYGIGIGDTVTISLDP